MLVEESVNPHRKLRRAIETMRGLGIVGVVFSAISVLAVYGTIGSRPARWIFLMPLAFVGTTTVHFVFASRIRARARWAVIGAIVIVSAEVLVAAIILCAVIMSTGLIDVARGKNVPAALGLGIYVLILILLVRLLADLVVSLEAIRLAPPPSGPRGFEPIPLASIAPDPPKPDVP